MTESAQMQICSVILHHPLKFGIHPISKKRGMIKFEWKLQYVFMFVDTETFGASRFLCSCYFYLLFSIKKKTSWMSLSISCSTAKLMHVSSLRGYFRIPFFFTRARRQVFWTHIKEGLTFAYAGGRLKQSSLSAERKKKFKAKRHS